MPEILVIDAVALRSLIDEVCAEVIANADAMTALDQAIGDGDHGLNMKRGFEAVRDQSAVLAEKPLPDALRQLGTTLVMKVGGASGPLYGTLFMTLGKELPPTPAIPDLARALGVAIDAIRRLGKSEAGHKTMLDVLIPVQSLLTEGGVDIGTRVAAQAQACAQATAPLRAIRGRASFLGDRSIGHVDPGAYSAALIIGAICNVLTRASP